MDSIHTRRIQLAGIHVFAGLTSGLGGIFLGIIYLHRDPEIAAHAFLTAIWGVSLLLLIFMLIVLMFPIVLVAALISHFFHAMIVAKLIILLLFILPFSLPWLALITGIIMAVRVWRGKRIFYRFPSQKMQRSMLQRLVPNMVPVLFAR